MDAHKLPCSVAFNKYWKALRSVSVLFMVQVACLSNFSSHKKITSVMCKFNFVLCGSVQTDWGRGDFARYACGKNTEAWGVVAREGEVENE